MKYQWVAFAEPVNLSPRIVELPNLLKRYQRGVIMPEKTFILDFCYQWHVYCTKSVHDLEFRSNSLTGC